MTTDHPRLVLAGLQTAGTPGDVEANLRELDTAARNASGNGADVLITPELFLTGYDIGDELRTLAELELVAPASEIAARHGIALVVGLPEICGESLYNSALFIDSSGVVQARHRKTHLFGELDRRFFTAGSQAATVVDYLGVRIAILICYDVEFPENVRMAALAGADLVAVPTAQMRPFEFVADGIIRARAWENQIYVAYVNHVGAERDTVYIGRSSIVAPDSGVVARIESGTGLIYGEIDTAVVRESQRRNPYLTDLRPELN